MKKKGIQIGIGFLLFIMALLPTSMSWFSLGLFIVSYLVVGFEIVLKAFRNILRGSVFDENFLMTIATLGAFAIREYPEAVAVMLFYQVGELFQSYAVDKSRKSIASLMEIRPDYANVKREGTYVVVEPMEVKVGEEILVKPGEKIPLDGVVVEGHSLVDTMALTGESVPREVEAGNDILSGCVNQSGILKIKVSKEFGESTVSKILDLVENASSKKSKSENFIRKFAKYYTPVVVVLAFLLAILPPLLIKELSFITCLERALSFLVVSCPCALVISIPLGFFGGIGSASRHGILVKGSNYLEALAQATIVVFDKTGTLTKGVFEVQEVNAIGMEPSDLLKYASYAESFSNHPISNSIKKAYGKEMDLKRVAHTEEYPGFGIKAFVDGKEILIGNQKLMKERSIAFQESTKIGTILYIAIDNEYKGNIRIADEVKKDSRKTIEHLKRNGIQKTVMLTGDRKEVGENVGRELQIDEVYTSLLPGDKVSKVEDFLEKQGKNEKLVFVGDGINDAPVLALSDIGVAMGGLGADAAVEAADIVIMTDEPSKIGTAMEIARRTLTIVKQNIGFALFVKAGVLLLSALGYATMWEAVFADVGVSVLAILNALRILSFQPKK